MTSETEQPTIRGDFHMHTHYSKDCGTKPKDLVERARRVGLTCIGVTDHNAIAGALEVQQLAPPELKVVIAEEIKTPYGEITGFFLTDEIPKGLSPVETCKRIKDQGGLISIPHPYDRFRRSVLVGEALSAIMPYIDIVEVFNARTPLLRDSQKALDFAKTNEFLANAGSDAHTLSELGHVYVEMPPFDGPEEFKNSLRHATINGRRSNPLYHAITTVTKWRKKYLFKDKPTK
ncbi:PHP domain-containing protein [Dehalococcoidia bacterium]|nr:PHP domain-containing protein [Dehalococcoidia bacterium]